MRIDRKAPSHVVAQYPMASHRRIISPTVRLLNCYRTFVFIAEALRTTSCETATGSTPHIILQRLLDVLEPNQTTHKSPTSNALSAQPFPTKTVHQIHSHQFYSYRNARETCHTPTLYTPSIVESKGSMCQITLNTTDPQQRPKGSNQEIPRCVQRRLWVCCPSGCRQGTSFRCPSISHPVLTLRH